MSRIVSLFAFLALFASNAYAQQDNDDTKKRLMDKIRKRIRAEHEQILKRVAKVIDEELSKIKPKPKPQPKGTPFDADIKKLSRQLRKAQLQMQDLMNSIRRLQRFQEGHKLALDAAKNGPTDMQDAGGLFESALAAHQEGDYKTSLRDFKKIFYNFKREQLGFTSAYNVSCGYALAGDKDRALDWLEICVENGFVKWDHIRQDTDMDSLRSHIRYKRLMADK